MDVQALIRALENNRYAVRFFSTKEEAADYLDQSIDGKTVGFGDSVTLRAMQIPQRLREHNTVYNPMETEGDENFLEVARKAANTEVFLTSVNAVAQTGELVNIDGMGNRVSGSMFWHEKVYFVIGTNKVEPTLEKAIWRARNIAAPQNAKRLGYNTPCAIQGDKCYNCNSPARICNAMVIHLKNMNDYVGKMQTEIILIDESLGI